MKTGLTKLLGIEYPIIQAPIGSATCPELAAAVSNAGGVGSLALSWSTNDLTRESIRKTKQLTSNPFAVNLVLDPGVSYRMEKGFLLTLDLTTVILIQSNKI